MNVTYAEILMAVERIQVSGHGELVVKIVDRQIVQWDETIRHRKSSPSGPAKA